MRSKTVMPFQMSKTSYDSFSRNPEWLLVLPFQTGFSFATSILKLYLKAILEKDLQELKCQCPAVTLTTVFTINQERQSKEEIRGFTSSFYRRRLGQEILTELKPGTSTRMKRRHCATPISSFVVLSMVYC
ncbi:hypothetical protein TNCV_1884321 [Trichonephila clavipes]|nr:hypothetical protein TNCV_1884321 [Trichonephila clavipes]